MNKIPFLKCGDCDRQLDPLEERWEHHEKRGRRIKSYCPDCMYRQVASYAERTIVGMLEGSVPVVVRAVVYGKPSEVKPE